MLTLRPHSKSLRSGSQPRGGLLCAQGWSFGLRVEGGRQGYAPAIVGVVSAIRPGTPANGFPMNR